MSTFRINELKKRLAKLSGILPITDNDHFKGFRESLFDREFYLTSYPDVRAAGVDPYDHFLKHGIAENRLPNPMFMPKYYLGQTSGYVGDPTRHYLEVGAKLGLDPHPNFDTEWYLSHYRDVEIAGLNPLSHFLQYGRWEGRSSQPEFRRRFSDRMPATFGYRFPRFSRICYFEGSSAGIASDFLPKFVLPLHFHGDYHWVILKVLKMAAFGSRLNVDMQSHVPVNTFPTLLADFKFCKLTISAHSIDVAYEEITVYRIENFVPSVIGCMGPSHIRFST